MVIGKKWTFSAKYSDNTAAEIAQATGLPMLTSRVLAARGVTDGDGARRYLDKSPKNLFDPMLMPDMEKAINVIRDAIAKREKIAVYGDYDVDGVTSNCIIVKYLRKNGAECVYYIPDRLNEGYGLNSCVIKKLAESGVKLIITVDTGITAVEEVKYAHELGLRIVITDHHECKDVIPDADAVVDPKRPDSIYPFKDLAGVGVAFKLICALAGPEKFDEILCDYSPLTALGTIADLMPLVSENRAIASFGMKMLETDLSPGYMALARCCELDERRRTSAISISYIIAPRINAAGRFGCAEKSVELFLTDDPVRADVLANELCDLNRQRQLLENDIRDQAMEKINLECDTQNDRAIVVWNENWHHGIIGIVTSKLTDQFGKPVIMLSVEGDEARGSGRSVEGFNLFAALQANSEYIEKFGGHELASGLTIKTENLEAFRKAFLEYANRELKPEECIPTMNVDCIASPEDFTMNEVEALSVLEPFGMANPQPLFCLRDMRVVCVSPIGNDRHTRLILASGPMRFDAVHFGSSADNAPYIKGSMVDLVFCADINTFKGRSIQFIIRDICLNKASKKNNERDISAYNDFMAGKKLDPKIANYIMPNRSEQIAVWKYISANSEDGILHRAPEDISLRIRAESGFPVNAGKLLVCCSVFKEFDLVDFKYVNHSLWLKIPDKCLKRDISSSAIMEKLRNAAMLG